MIENRVKNEVYIKRMDIVNKKKDVIMAEIDPNAPMNTKVAKDVTTFRKKDNLKKKIDNVLGS